MKKAVILRVGPETVRMMSASVPSAVSGSFNDSSKVFTLDVSKLDGKDYLL